MVLKNVSGRARTQNSDIDIQVWLSRPTYNLVKKVFPKLSISTSKIEIFINCKESPNAVALAAIDNIRIQRSWDKTTFNKYLSAKLEIAYLTGSARKDAKAKLATEFGLSTIPYIQGV